MFLIAGRPTSNRIGIRDDCLKSRYTPVSKNVNTWLRKALFFLCLNLNQLLPRETPRGQHDRARISVALATLLVHNEEVLGPRTKTPTPRPKGAACPPARNPRFSSQNIHSSPTTLKKLLRSPSQVKASAAQTSGEARTKVAIFKVKRAHISHLSAFPGYIHLGVY